MKISVIIPIYGAEKYLSKCINSVLSQTFTDFELILIDDQSPDKCGEICDEFAKKDNRIKVIHQQNTGVSGARNAGIQLAQGEYLCFVDNDDCVHPYLLEFLLGMCLKNNVTMAMCGFCEVLPDSEIKVNQLENLPTEIINPFTYIERLCTHLQVQYVVPWGKLYHKSIFTNVEYPLATLNEDDCVIHTLALNAEKIAVCYEHLYFYCINPESISRKGIPIKPWIRSLAYKENRMEILKQKNELQILFTVQRLLFYDLLLERSRLCKKKYKSERKYLINYAAKLYFKIFKNPKAAKSQLLKMPLFLVFSNKIKKYTHNDFLL